MQRLWCGEVLRNTNRNESSQHVAHGECSHTEPTEGLSFACHRAVRRAAAEQARTGSGGRHVKRKENRTSVEY